MFNYISIINSNYLNLINFLIDSLFKWFRKVLKDDLFKLKFAFSIKIFLTLLAFSIINPSISQDFSPEFLESLPEDVRAVAKDVLRHRIGLSYEAEAENISAENIITTILNTVEVP